MISKRYFGLKPLIRPVQNNFVPVIVLNEVDALLSPIALLLCYYTSAIFLQDIHKKKVWKNSVKIEYSIADLFEMRFNQHFFPQKSIPAVYKLPDFPLKSTEGKEFDVQFEN